MAYYSTSHSLGTVTTSTAALQVWRALSSHLRLQRKPMTGEELSEQTGLPESQIAQMFAQAYYLRHYGFRRFASLGEWTEWAESAGVLRGPEPEVTEPAELEDEDEDEEEWTDEPS